MPPRKPRIIVFGGSFDPPHVGHAQLLYAALAQIWCERAYIVPSFQQVLKGGHYCDIRDRLAMVQLNFSAEVPFDIVVSDLEARANRAMYTWEVLDHFQAQHKDREVIFLAGDDCLATFNRWDRADYLAQRYTFLIGSRGIERPVTYGLLPRTENVFVKNPCKISSTGIRDMMLDGKTPAGMLHPLVAAYIKEHGLYGPTERVDPEITPCCTYGNPGSTK